MRVLTSLLNFTLNIVYSFSEHFNTSKPSLSNPTWLMWCTDKLSAMTMTFHMCFLFTSKVSLISVRPCWLSDGTVHPVMHHHVGQTANSEQSVWDWHSVSKSLSLSICLSIHLELTHSLRDFLTHNDNLGAMSYQYIFYGTCADISLVHTW